MTEQREKPFSTDVQVSSCRAKPARFSSFCLREKGWLARLSICGYPYVIRVLISIRNRRDLQSVSRDSIGGFVISRGIKLRGLIIDRVQNLERNERGLISVIVRTVPVLWWKDFFLWIKCIKRFQRKIVETLNTNDKYIYIYKSIFFQEEKRGRIMSKNIHYRD